MKKIKAKASKQKSGHSTFDFLRFKEHGVEHFDFIWDKFDAYLRKYAKRHTLPIGKYTNIETLVIYERLSDPIVVNRRAIRIENKTSIAQVIDFFDERKEDWLRPWDTVPIGTFSLALETHENTVAKFWVSGGVIVTHDEKAHLWRFSDDDDYNTLAAILGLDPYPVYQHDTPKP